MRLSLLIEVLGATVVVVAAILFLTQGTDAAAPPPAPRLHWRLVDLGTLPGAGRWDGDPESGATALAPNGDVVGDSYTYRHASHGFLWHHGRMLDLGALGGSDSSAKAIDGGRIAGWADTKAGERHAVVWIGGRIHDLGTMGRSQSEAEAIASDGTVVGYAYDLDAQGLSVHPRAIVWRRGRASVLGSLQYAGSIAPDGRILGDTLWVAGHAVRTGLSELQGFAGPGALVGNRTRDVHGNTHSRAFVWRNGTLTDLGELPGHGNCAARSANARAWVVGSCTNDVGGLGFLWRNGQMAQIGGNEAEPYAVNDRGIVVGEQLFFAANTMRAFAWYDGRQTFLPILPHARRAGDPDYEAFYVNDRGDIAGAGTDADGERRAMLWLRSR